MLSFKHKRLLCALLAALLLPLFGCKSEPESQPDPHIGEVCVANGMGGTMWVPLYDTLPVSTLRAEDFYSDGQFVAYSGDEYIAKRGIDVSEHQHDIDWEAVRAQGVEFAIIRAGYRGYSAGQLYEDEFFRTNIEGALSKGIEVGIYFYSQAINTDEAAEEALFLLDIIADYGNYITLPIFYDWEHVSNVGQTRCDDMTGAEITDCCIAFCDVIAQAGYETGVYFYRALGYRDYELNRLSHLIFWAAAPGTTPDFYYKHSIWQYSYTAQINGIQGDTDLDIMFVEKTAPAITPGDLPAPEGSIPAK